MNYMVYYHYRCNTSILSFTNLVNTLYNKRGILSTSEKFEICAISNRAFQWWNKWNKTIKFAFPFIFFILFCTLFCSLSQIKPGRQDVPFAVLGPIIFIINLRQLNWYWHNCILRTDLRTNLECIYFVSNVCRIVLLSSTMMTLIGRNKSHACIRLYPKTSPRF